MRVAHLLSLVQDGVEGAALERTRGGSQVRELAQQALDGTGGVVLVVLLRGGE